MQNSKPFKVTAKTTTVMQQKATWRARHRLCPAGHLRCNLSLINNSQVKILRYFCLCPLMLMCIVQSMQRVTNGQGRALLVVSLLLNFPFREKKRKWEKTDSVKSKCLSFSKLHFLWWRGLHKFLWFQNRPVSMKHQQAFQFSHNCGYRLLLNIFGESRKAKLTHFSIIKMSSIKQFDGVLK